MIWGVFPPIFGLTPIWSPNLECFVKNPILLGPTFRGWSPRVDVYEPRLLETDGEVGEAEGVSAEVEAVEVD